MKNLNFVFVVVVFACSIVFTSCSYVTRPAVSAAETTWEEVEARYHTLETEADYKAVEDFSKEIAAAKWAKWQYEYIKFKLAKSLYNQGQYKKSLEVFEELRGLPPYINETHLTAGDASLKTANYDGALKWVLSVYLKLDRKEKIKASKIVFLSYLYSKRVEKAAVWYSMLDEQKKGNVKDELEEWLNKSEMNKRDFNNYLSMAPEYKSGEIPSGLQEEVQDEMSRIDKKLEETAEDSEENILSSEVAFDENYMPDWTNLCVMLSLDEKWSKFNEVISSFFPWYFTDYKKSGINIVFLNYLDEKDLAMSFEKAKEAKCFAVAGPFFATEFAEDFIRKSIETSIPVISYSPFVSASTGLFFNIMPTKDLEAENILKYAITEKEKKKFAIAYVDNKDGRILRDIYWEQVESLGGQVTDIIDLSPSDNAFFDDVDKVVGKPGNYDEAVKSFRYMSKEKLGNETLVKRAVDRFIKTIPGRCKFDSLIVLTPVTQMSMFLPSFPYVNVEFDYYQNYLKRNVALKEQNLKQDGYDWNIQQILLLAPSEIVSSEKVIEQLGQIVDGMVVYSPVNDFSTGNKVYSEISSSFLEKKGRNLYYIENFIAEISEIIFQSYSKSGNKNIGGFVNALKETEFTSVLSGTAVKFDSKLRMTGRSKIMIGRNKEPFMTQSQIEEQIKKSEEEKKKELEKEKKAK